MDIKIVVATHKTYWMPDDPIYLPLQVGAKGKEPIGFQRDDIGENISERNLNYCELTGLYWAWKNLQADYIGLVHYRRHFSNQKLLSWNKRGRVISQDGIEQKLKVAPILLPKSRHYWIETNYNQYVHAHHAVDLDLTRDILSRRYPDYIQSFDLIMRRTTGHRFNMFIMRRDLLEHYCQWLFSILFELEKKLDISNYNKNDARVFGFVGERLLDVWLTTNNLNYQELSYVFLEKQNWILKGKNFLERKMKRAHS